MQALWESAEPGTDANDAGCGARSTSGAAAEFPVRVVRIKAETDLAIFIFNFSWIEGGYSILLATLIIDTSTAMLLRPAPEPGE